MATQNTQLIWTKRELKITCNVNKLIDLWQLIGAGRLSIDAYIKKHVQTKNEN